MPRVVIDTNTWISGLIWGGTPRRLIRRAFEGEDSAQALERFDQRV